MHVNEDYYYYYSPWRKGTDKGLKGVQQAEQVDKTPGSCTYKEAEIADTGYWESPDCCGSNALV